LAIEGQALPANRGFPVRAIRRANERGRSELGWLSSAHTFSFGEYHDPTQMGFRSLRVINEDRVAKATGFGAHPHRDMEIVTWVLAGALRHEDSMGNGSVIRPGDLQRMSAGTGVVHSEWNASHEEPVHFLQIWILPAKDGIPPSYEQRNFPAEERRNRLRLVASPDGAQGSVRVHQDAKLWIGSLDAGAQVAHALAPDAGAWLQVARGRVRLGDVVLDAGDGVAVATAPMLEILAEPMLEISAEAPAEVLLFELH